MTQPDAGQSFTMQPLRPSDLAISVQPIEKSNNLANPALDFPTPPTLKTSLRSDQ
jgi:hypothetical protein